MIHKVYIVRCSQCHGFLRNDSFFDCNPRYFNNIESITQALAAANWKVINGMELCDKCCDSYGHSSEL